MNLFQLIASLARKSGEQRDRGKKSRANGTACVVMGILLLPVPFIGLPLILIGLAMACD